MNTEAQDQREALGARLRVFRRDAGYTSGRSFAAAAGFHESKVSRVEHGKQLPSEEDLHVWCEVTGQQSQLPDLVAALRHINELWLEWKRQLSDGATSRQQKAIPVYAKTKLFRIWHPTLVWGALQTADYAEETFKQVVSFYDIPDDIESARDKRLERQKYLYEGDRAFHVLLAEQALYSNFGGRNVMLAQLEWLLNVMRLPRLSLGLVPRSAPLWIWPGNSFSMFDEKLVLVETYSAELSVTKPSEIEMYVKAFGLLKRSAVYGDSAKELIRSAIRHYDRY
ncbi:helix-turn-helix domain-containing protein [Streptomyces xanthochromogenes]|uniref:helix-turn-helix domain-containing protein n=1 Tax=Streptomyces xanthochromogenes TaxID=67384 RepID=UPI0037FE2BD4